MEQIELRAKELRDRYNRKHVFKYLLSRTLFVASTIVFGGLGYLIVYLLFTS